MQPLAACAATFDPAVAFAQIVPPMREVDLAFVISTSSSNSPPDFSAPEAWLRLNGPLAVRAPDRLGPAELLALDQLRQACARIVDDSPPVSVHVCSDFEHAAQCSRHSDTGSWPHLLVGADLAPVPTTSIAMRPKLSANHYPGDGATLQAAGLDRLGLWPAYALPDCSSLWPGSGRAWKSTTPPASRSAAFPSTSVAVKFPRSTRSSSSSTAWR